MLQYTCFVVQCPFSGVDFCNVSLLWNHSTNFNQIYAEWYSFGVEFSFGLKSKKKKRNKAVKCKFCSCLEKIQQKESKFKN